MKKILMAGAALALLSAAAHADDQKKRTFGATAGGATGAIAGAVVGGPVGAVVGGVAGAALGAETAVPEGVRTYVAENPVESVTLEAPLTAEYVVPESVTIHEIPADPGYGYIYVDGRPAVVKMDSRQVVYVPAADSTASVSVEVPDTVVTYVREHPVDPVVLEGKVSVGSPIPDSVELIEVPESPDYAYVYVDNGPVLVERSTRKVVWVQ